MNRSIDVSGLSSEFRRRLLAEEGLKFVSEAYLYALDRPADPVGLKGYVGQLAGGASKEKILAELEESPEGQRVALRRRCWRRIRGDE